MENTFILYPMFALIIWTLIIAVVTIKRAHRAVGEGLNPEYFRFGKGFKPPGYLLSAYQHYSNLFEMPMLFYAAALTIYVTAVNSTLLTLLAWLYLALRTVHSLYHLSNADLLRRRNSFIMSYIVLVLLWAVTAIEFVRHS